MIRVVVEILVMIIAGLFYLIFSNKKALKHNYSQFYLLLSLQTQN